jgi:glycosyltransferase involved in cell wall biosynthesis
MPIGIKLKKLGKKVIFYSHEDVPKQILDREYLNKYALKVISRFLTFYERYAGSKFDAIVTATPAIKEKFLEINKKSIDINNYPIVDELSNASHWKIKKDEVAYIGGIADIRGIKEVVLSLQYIENIFLNLVGEFVSNNTKTEVSQYKGWEQVIEHGFLDRKRVSDILSRSKAGLVTFHPLPNHMDAQPNKIFEYMSAGIPVIASNFPLWKEIVEGSNCGICVNPLNPKEISQAIQYIVDNPKEAETMGKNGEKAVREKYNWHNEEKKLLALYQELTK